MPQPDHRQKKPPFARQRPIAPQVAENCPVIPVETVLNGMREAVLVHNGEHYRLRLTSNDKLILTK